MLNEFQKKIFETGYFESVKLSISGKKINIFVVENPLINFFYIEGINNKSISEKVYSFVNIKENDVFKLNLIKKDIGNINEYLKSLGYLNNKVNYKINDIKNSKVNIFYEVKLNNKFKINRIFFLGNKYYKSSKLSDVINSVEHGWWKFLSNTAVPTSDLVESDISKLKNFYLNKGFYDVQIISNSINILNDEYANLIYTINSGNKYFFNKPELLNNTSTLSKSDIVNLKSFFIDFEKEEFSKVFLNHILNKLEKYIISNNYNLTVNYKLFKTDKNKIKVDFIINEPNKIKTIKNIKFVGNAITDDSTIRNKLSFAEGDVFNLSSIKKSIDKIEGSDLFTNVNYETIENNSGDTVDLIISVKEKPTGEIGAAAGGGTAGAQIGGFLNEKNFLGKGIQLNTNITIGTQKIYGSFKYSDPDFRNSGNRLTGSLFVENNKYDNASYENKVIGTMLATNYEIFDQIYFNPGIKIDLDSLTANSDASSLIKKRQGDYLTTLFTYNLSKNTLNKQYNPTDGHMYGIGQGFSILSDVPYLKNNIFGSYYNEYSEGFVGSIKYQISSIDAFNDEYIKFSDRLHANPNNLRGFASRGIGPKLEGDFIGGNYMYSTSVSSTVPNGFPDKWNAVTNVFLDVANVWGVDDNSTDETNKIRSSAGVGLSWMSPIGPVAFTYATPITKSNTDDIEQFNFKIGSAF